MKKKLQTTVLFLLVLNFLYPGKEVLAQTCTLDFSFTVEGNLFHGQIADSLNFSKIDSLQWDFGDGIKKYDNRNNYYYQYGNFDTFSVCLKAFFSNPSCTSLVCKDVAVPMANAEFKIAQYGPQVTLTPKYNLRGFSYNWTFGDGNGSSENISTHTYSSTGNFRISLLVYDSTSQTYDTSFQNVTINELCKANAWAKVSSNTSFVEFINLSAGNNLESTWHFGDGDTSHRESPSHGYSNTGIFVYSLHVKGLSGCNDSVSDTVYIQTVAKCKSSFGYSFNLLEVNFSNYSSGDQPSYLWTFGDGDSSLAKAPSHIYSRADTYNVCLTITDKTNSCTDKLCRDVIVTGNDPRYYIYGKPLLNGGKTPNNHIAYLIQHDSSAGTLSLVDSFRNDSFGETYYLSGTVTRSYLVKCALSHKDPDYSNYLPTYAGDVLYWDSALIVNERNSKGLNISLIRGNNPGGPAFIGGKVTQGANKKGVGDPVPGILVLLLTTDGMPVTYDYSDQNGDYGFSNIAFGDYQIYPELAGKKTFPYDVTVDENNKEIKNIGIKVRSGEITTFLPETSKSFAEGITGEVFPNPATNQVTFRLNLKENITLSKVRLYTSPGKLILEESLSERGNTFTHTIKTDNLPRGSYFIRVLTGNGLPITLPTVILH